MKKGVFVLLLVSIVLASFLVSAQSITEDLKKIGEGFWKVIKPIANFAIGGGESLNSDVFFARILLLVLLIVIIWLALERIPFFEGRTWAVALISILAAILAIRFTSNTQWINAILLPYSALGVALTAGLPFVIFFYVINRGMEGREYQAFRRVAWVFFAVIFIGLWWSRTYTIGTDVQGLGSVGWIYIMTAVLSLAMLALDGTVQRFFLRARTSRADVGSRRHQVAELTRELGEIHEDYRRQGAGYTAHLGGHSHTTGRQAYLADVRMLRDQIDDIGNN